MMIQNMVEGFLFIYGSQRLKSNMINYFILNYEKKNSTWLIKENI